MGFVKTAEEVKEIEQLLSEGRFTEGVTVEFETTREIVRSVLPPCFEPADEPIAYANVARWQRNVCGEFDCATMNDLIHDFPAIDGRVRDSLFS